MPGLLDTFFGTPEQTQALGLLGAGLMSGNPAAAFGNANQYLAESPDRMAKRQMTQMQMQDLQQQIAMRNIALQQQQQEWNMRLPFMQALSSQMAGNATPGATASQPATAPTPGGSLGSGTFGIPSGGQQASSSAPLAPGGAFLGIPSNVVQGTVALEGFKGLSPLIAKFNEPTELMKTMDAAGIQRGSPEWNRTLQTSVAKSNYIAPVNARPGSILRDPITNQPVAFNPHVPDGSTPVFDASGNVVGLRPLNGAYQAIAAAKTAEGMGSGAATPTVAYDASGKPVFSTKAADVRRAGGSMPGEQPTLPQPGLVGNFRGDPSLIATAIGDIKDPQERANAQAALEEQIRRTPNGSGLTPEQRPGVVKGATLSQDELSAKGRDLMASNGQVNTVISRLQNIKMLAPGAITGAETSRRDFMNGLLSLAGIKGAEDAKTASDLVDKNASQIVSALRMGQGGAGTDALQTLLGAANPNRHMTKEAIQEAADQLIASQRMIQDKARILQPHYLGRDPVAYGQKEMLFDQNADPRVWQLLSMTPQQQKTYVQSLPPEVAADLLNKRKALKSIGAIQ